jgi:hypothetical protein
MEGNLCIFLHAKAYAFFALYSTEVKSQHHFMFMFVDIIWECHGGPTGLYTGFSRQHGESG